MSKGDPDGGGGRRRRSAPKACTARAAPNAQYRPKAGKKKKTLEVGLFFWFPLRTRCFIREWVNPTFPDRK